MEVHVCMMWGDVHVAPKPKAPQSSASERGAVSVPLISVHADTPLFCSCSSTVYFLVDGRFNAHFSGPTLS